MPYIDQSRRGEVASQWNHIETVGELNYVLTFTIMNHLSDMGISYTNINNIIGGLEGILHSLQEAGGDSSAIEFIVDQNNEFSVLFCTMLEILVASNENDKFDWYEIIGAVRCVELELYRRVAAPYENQKAFDNGDVYE